MPSSLNWRENYSSLSQVQTKSFWDILRSKKYFSFTFGLIAFYDRDFSSRLQLQQTVALSLTYNVSTFRRK